MLQNDHPKRTLDISKVGRKADDFAKHLRESVVGQDEAVAQIVQTYQTHLVGLSSTGRPIATFLFLGPTGTGKTRIVESTAEALLNKAGAVIKIDCAEFQHDHEIAKLIGSPPGYIGHRESRPRLSQDAIDKHHTESTKISIVLFDEIEKASDTLWNLLLGILDKGIVTLGDNQPVDFSRSLIFMTSNLGAAEMNAMLSPKLGFAPAATSSNDGDKLSERIASTGVEAARRRFTPEFINRLDKIVVFKPLGDAELTKILDIELTAVEQRLCSAPTCALKLRVFDAAKRHLLQEGTDARYGARHLKRTIERLVVQPIANLIATEQVSNGDIVCVDLCSDSGQLEFWKECGAVPEQKIAATVKEITQIFHTDVGFWGWMNAAQVLAAPAS
jgi:ATP-dependent Clp protease ATP-binding subunit ClpB